MTSKITLGSTGHQDLTPEQAIELDLCVIDLEPCVPAADAYGQDHYTVRERITTPERLAEILAEESHRLVWTELALVDDVDGVAWIAWAEDEDGDRL